MALTIENLRAKSAKLTGFITRAKEVLAQPQPTIKQISTSIGHVQKMIQSVGAFVDVQATNEEPNFNFEIETFDLFEEAELTLIELKATLAEIERNIPPPLAPENRNQNINQGPKFSANNIKVTIPYFDGEYCEYPSFIAAFHSAMEDDGKSKPMQLRILEQQLRGRALTLIRNLPKTDAGFDNAIQILEETFNVKSRQKDALMDRIKKMPEAQDDLFQIRNTYEEIESILRALEPHVTVDTDEQLRCNVMACYSDAVLNYVIPNNVETPTLKMIREGVKCVIRRKEDTASIRKTYATEKTGSIPIATAAAAASSIPKSKAPASGSTSASNLEKSKKNKGNEIDPDNHCSFCRLQNHRSSECRKFATATERINQLPKGTCYACLQGIHSRKWCKNKKKCPECSTIWHHAAICNKKFGAWEPSKESAPASKEEPNATPEPEKKIKTTVALINSNESCYMTAKACIRNPLSRESIQLRIFMDSGANQCYVLTRYGKELRLVPISCEKLLVGVFMRPEIEEVDTQRVMLEILDPKSGTPYPVMAYMVPKITNKLTSYDITKFYKNFPQLEEMNFAKEGNEEEIGLLIGNNYLWNFIKPESKITLAPNLHILSTIFGRMIVGSTDHLEARISHVHSIDTKCLNVLWSLEALGIADKSLSKSEEEENAIRQFNSTIKYLPDFM